jgi:hypothetical protein
VLVGEKLGEEVGFLEVHCRMVLKMEDDWKRWMQKGQCGLLIGRWDDWIAVVD